ncbi:MAG: LamG domain-containing protein [Parcubacteria group bacterium]
MKSLKQLLKIYTQTKRFLQVKKPKFFGTKNIFKLKAFKHSIIKKNKKAAILVVAMLIIASSSIFVFDVFSQQSGSRVLDMSLSAENYDAVTNTFYDRSGNDNHSDYINNVNFVDGRYGSIDGAMSFDENANSGTGEYVEVGNIENFSNEEITSMAWIKPNASSDARAPITRIDRFYLQHYSNDRLATYWYGWNKPGYHTSSVDSVPVGVWTHVAVTWDQANGVTFYINGEKDNQISNSGTGDDIGWIKIGQENSSRRYDGLIEDIKVYNRSLSQEEIQNIYNSSQPMVSGSNLNKGLVGHWSMDEDDFIEGTENLAPYTDYSDRNYNEVYNASCWGGDGATIEYFDSGGYNDMPYKKLIKTDAGTGGCYHNNSQYFDIENNTTYIISAYIKANRNQSFNGHVLNINRPSDNRYKTSSGFDVTTEWQRYYWVYNSSSDDAGTYQAKHIIYIDDNLPLEVYWSGFQIEEKSDITPYVNGTRVGTLTEKTPYSNHGDTGIEQSFSFNEDRFGKEGGAMSFNGIDNVATAGNIIDNNFDAYTVSLWAKPNNIRTSEHDMLISDVGGHWWYVSINGTKWFYRNDETGDIWSNDNVQENEWYHIVINNDGYDATMYINGEQQGTVGNGSGFEDSVFSLEIGKYSASYPLWDGLIDDVKIYNRILSEAEIQSLYDSYEPKISAGSLNKGLILDMPLTLKYTKDETSGSEIMTDKTPYSNDGQNYGATISEEGADFDGVDDYLKISHDASLNTQEEITISSWFLTRTNSSGHMNIIGKKYSTAWELNIVNNDLYFNVNIGGNFYSYFLRKDDIVTENTWNHALFTYNSNDGVAKLYFNNVLVDSRNVAGLIGVNTHEVEIGHRESSLLWNGKISNVRIYNRALSETEVKSLYDKGRSSSGMIMHEE